MILKKTRYMVDGHVHIYPCYNLETFFRAALTNLEYYYRALYGSGSPEAVRILLLTEGKNYDYFSQFKEKGGFPNNSGYGFLETGEEESIALVREGKRLGYLVRGRQIVSKENLEVLAIGTKQVIEDGMPIEAILDRLLEKKEIAVLAWGFGKWWFKRGRIIENLVEKNRSPYLLVGDNSGRPVFWREPRVFKRAAALNISLINGSDPLPFKGEENKAGTYGFSVEGEFNEEEPNRSLKEILTSPAPVIDNFGRRDSAISFIKRQSKIYLKKYLKGSAARTPSEGPTGHLAAH